MALHHKIIPCLIVLILSVFSGFIIRASSDSSVLFGGANYYAPYYYRDAEGELKGFDIALFKAVAKEAGFSARFRLGDWDRIQGELVVGRIDVVPMLISPEREERYLFSDPILIDNHILFGLRGATNRRELSTLSGKQIAAEQGAYALQELRNRGINVKAVGAQSEADALRLVETGQVDYALIPANVGYYVIEHESLANVVPLSPPLLPVTYAYAISRQRPELVDAINQALLNLQERGVITQLNRQWLSPDSSDNVWLGLSRPLWIIVPLILTVILATVGIWQYRKRLRVVQSTLTRQENLLREAESRADEDSMIDSLTNLYKRDFFVEYVDQALLSAVKQDKPLAVGVFTLLGLDLIQHTAGYRVGDDLIRRVASDILECPDFTAYLGQGVFAFLLEGIINTDEAISRTQVLGQTASRGYEIQGSMVQLQAISGIVVCSECNDKAPELLRKARLALSQAQRKNNSISVYDPSMEPDPRNITLMSDLKNALTSNGLTWAHQPQYSIKEQRIVGGEMLARWQHPRHGWVPPDYFISLAEQTGLIKNVTQSVIHQAINVLKQWDNIGSDWKLSINVSANDLADQAIIEDMIRRFGDYAAFLTLEITETAIMQDIEAIINNVEHLRRANIRIALDDYGTGYSSLEYLKAFNFDEIKIDQVFINNITQSERNYKLTQASINLSHELGSQVVAEGVEDEETARLLAVTGCDILQGYGISKPLNIEDFVKFSKHYQMKLGD